MYNAINKIVCKIETLTVFGWTRDWWLDRRRLQWLAVSTSCWSLGPPLAFAFSRRFHLLAAARHLMPAEMGMAGEKALPLLF